MGETGIRTILKGALERAVEPVLASFKVPGMVVGVAKGEAHVEHIAIGTDAAELPLTPDSLFPVASITKLATALAVLCLVDAGRLELDAPLARYLPDAAAAQPGVTLRALLSHTGGLPDDLSPESVPYVEGLKWRSLALACLKTPPDRPPRTRVHYSNVGYGLLAQVVERESGQDFPEGLKSLVLDPLGIEGYIGVDPLRPAAMIGYIRSGHAGTPLEPYNTHFWRGLGLPWGGLLTNADGALRLVRAFAGVPGNFLGPPLRAEATRNQTGDLAGGYQGIFSYSRCPWGLGPDLRDGKQPHWAPPESSPDTYGHAGASGSVVWYDPSADIAWAILGARPADNGWLLRGAPSIGRAILAALT